MRPVLAEAAAASARWRVGFTWNHSKVTRRRLDERACTGALHQQTSANHADGKWDGTFNNSDQR
jgi:hypothetical protein